MPLLDIAIARSSFLNFLGNSRVHLFINGKIPNYEYRWASFRKSFQNTGYLNFSLGHCDKNLHHKFFVRSVATLEPKCSIQSKKEEKESNVLSSSIEPLSPSFDSDLNGDSEEIDEREKLRRIRISKANKGNTPWNKGRKHSPETRQRIRERTRLAMQNPKVKMKLANIGHAQSPETREKIAVGVRMGWQKRRERLLLQETCHFDWKNLVAEAARKGFQDEEELQWDSYKIINEQLQQEWLASIEQRKKTPTRPKTSKRAPKSLEQRRKIAEAIAAKWADPEYRSRVTTGLAKYHGTTEGAERKAKKKPSDKSESQGSAKKKASSAERSAATVKAQQPKLKKKLKKKSAPKYKDPLANSKLEMLKNIRAQRVASEERKNEALERAKLLIAEAEKAAKALEIAATRSPVARASLIEARELIAEATQSIESIENEEVTSQGDPTLMQQNHIGKYETDDTDEGHHRGVNGTVTGIVQTTEGRNQDNNAYKMPILEEMDMNRDLQSQIDKYELAELDIGSFIWTSELEDITDQKHSLELNGAVKLNGLSSHHGEIKMDVHEEQEPYSAAKPVTKRWVRGRLEVMEGE